MSRKFYKQKPIPNPTIRAGARVRSHYRARWTGEVVKIGGTHAGREIGDACALVRVTHDRRGRPFRKPLWHVLSTWWLDPVPTVDTPIHYMLRDTMQLPCGEYRRAFGRLSPDTRNRDRVTCPGCLAYLASLGELSQ